MPKGPGSAWNQGQDALADMQALCLLAMRLLLLASFAMAAANMHLRLAVWMFGERCLLLLLLLLRGSCREIGRPVWSMVNRPCTAPTLATVCCMDAR